MSVRRAIEAGKDLVQRVKDEATALGDAWNGRIIVGGRDVPQGDTHPQNEQR